MTQGKPPRFRAVDWFDDEEHRDDQGDDDAYPREIRERERALLVARRRQEDDGRPPVAVGLSGGGIRSATFCLGFFQGLAKLNLAALPRPDDERADDGTLRAGSLLARVDVLSSTSGGGYFGSFLGRFFERGGGIRPAPEPEADQLPTVERSLADNFSPQMAWLRENGRYLAPNGAGDALLAGAAIFRNWIALQLVLGSLVMTIFLALQGVLVVTADGLRAAGLVDRLNELQALLQGGPPYWVWRSPLLLLPILTTLFTVAPAAWAYWMLPSRKRREGLRWRWLLVRFPSFAWVTAFLAAVCLTVLVALPRLNGLDLGEWQVVVPVTASLLVVSIVALVLWVFYYGPWRPLEELERRAPGTRTALTKFLRFWLFTTLGLLAVALIDGLGQTLYAAAASGDGAVRTLLVGLLGGGGLLADVVRRLYKLVGDKMGDGPSTGQRASMRLALVVTAAAAVLAIAHVASVLSHAIAWSFQPPTVPVHLAFLDPHLPARAAKSLDLVFGAFLFFALVSLSIGRTFSFLNYSSHHLIYAARLTRAYLGASNPVRHAQGIKVTDVHFGDDVRDLRDYHPERRGGPLHLVCVTINETISGRSNVQQQDRKGVGLAAGPCGFSAGKSHHSLWHDERNVQGVPGDGFRMFPPTAVEPEPLSLGQWTAISGAAFTTGAGVRTSLPLALLAGLANVRVGYWWDSGIEPSARHPPSGNRARQAARTAQAAIANPAQSTAGFLRFLLPTQLHLVDELTARFRGPAARRWYLSDGGHFENLAGYELVRRRFPVIVLVDATADPDYGYEDLANLVRKARIDFGAEIRFLDQEELDRTFGQGEVPRAVGPLAKLGRGKDRSGCSQCSTALATVEYPRPPGERPRPVSLLVYVKAALCEDSPLDLAEYHGTHPDFPHESTGDQFFDEAQWESYRRLGEWQAMTLFGPGGWDLLGAGGSRAAIAALVDKLYLQPEPADLPPAEAPAEDTGAAAGQPSNE